MDFFHIKYHKIILMFVWKRPKLNEKEAGEGPFKKNNYSCTDSLTVTAHFAYNSTYMHLKYESNSTSTHMEVFKIGACHVAMLNFICSRAEVYSAMAESLGLAWKDLNNLLEQRKIILDQNYLFQGHLQVNYWLLLYCSF